MAGLLIFVATQEDAFREARRYTDPHIITSQTGPLALRKAITHLAENGTVIATAAMCTGWRAPMGTQLHIDPSLPEFIQTQARALVPRGPVDAS